MSNLRELNKLITAAKTADNSANDMLTRGCGFRIYKEITVGGTGTQVSNILQVTGTVAIINQFAIITRVGTLTNLTGVYADIWDGTNAVPLTSATGAVLSGATVGTFFTKDKIASEVYSINFSDECRMLETTDAKKAGRPFSITQKNATDTFIRFHSITTDAPVDFDVEIYFEYVPMDGGTLTFL